MLTAEVDPATTEPEELVADYERALAEVLAEVDAATAAEETGIGVERLAALEAGERPDPELTVAEAAAVFALSPEYPDADATLAEVRDGLLLDMSTAILDVDAVAAGLDGDLDATVVQQKIEGRQEMTLGEYARIRHLVAERGRD